MAVVPSVTMYGRPAYLVCQGVRLAPALVVGATAIIMGCTATRPPFSQAVIPANSTDSSAERMRVVHALNRLTFGPRPGEVDRVLRIGLDRWLDAQLRPDTALDANALGALSAFSEWSAPMQAALTEVAAFPAVKSPTTSNSGVMIRTRVVLQAGGSLRVARRDSALNEALRSLYQRNAQLLTGRLTRGEMSERQLLEVMTDFWENHFSVFSDRTPSRASMIEWDRVAIRPHALGKFRDLLGAVAHHPAMLGYLDNALSRADALNENYTRELLELHTLGVDGGYTQHDVVEVARAFTGWSHTWIFPNAQPLFVPRPGTPPSPVFVFNQTAHDTGVKHVLGHTLAAGRGIEDGEAVLDLLARHPATARFLARKLVKRFVSDDPPASLVDRAAATYSATDGDISAVVRTIATSEEFFSSTAFRSKIKSPIELVLSTRRILGAPVDTAAELIDDLIALEQVPFSHSAPDGWPDGAVWLNAGAMRSRVALALRIAHGEMSSIPLEAWPAWTSLSVAPFDQQVDGVVRGILFGYVSRETREALERGRPSSLTPVTDEMRRESLRELVALALASPEFQRR